MERWLSRSRVLLGLCAVLLIAALNRQDPMVYGMFLFLAVVSVLGFALPWLSLRSMTVRLGATGNMEITEGEGCDLNLLVERTARWPAFMVAVETEWEWASRRIVLSQTLPIVRAGHPPDLGRMVQFPCRGHYALVAVRLSSGFPLGLIHAHHTLARPQVHLRVLPQAQAVRWPLPWDVTADPLGELSTRRLGQSFELGMLRPYQHGESVGRVSWRASARAGELVIQHFQQSGAMRLRLAVDIPGAAALGDADSAAEQAIRLAAGVCDAAQAHGVQLRAYLPGNAAPLRDGVAIRRALADAAPTAHSLLQTVAQIAADTAVGEQVAVVVAAGCGAEALIQALSAVALKNCPVVVCIAVGRSALPQERAQAKALQKALADARMATFLEMP
jgi:uncharacterized protein (DUF58 family)